MDYIQSVLLFKEGSRTSWNEVDKLLQGNPKRFRPRPLRQGDWAASSPSKEI